MSSIPPASAIGTPAILPGVSDGGVYRPTVRIAPWAPTPMATVWRAVPPLSLWRIAKDTLLITLLLLLNIFGNVGAGVFFAILVVMTFRSPELAFKALLIMWMGLMTNQMLVPKSLVWTPCRLALPFLSFARFSFDLIALRTSLFAKVFYTSFIVYCLIMAMCSVISGWYTLIALIKLINFWVSVSAVFAGAVVLVRRRFDIGEWLVSLIIASTVMALVAIAVNGGIVQIREGVQSTHFGGAFLHPNCHGSHAAMFVVALVMVFTFTRYQNRWIVWPLLAAWLLFMVWSKSRTSFVSTVLGMLTLFPFLATSVRTKWIRRVSISRPTAVVVGVGALVVLVIANIAVDNAIGDAVVAFINKSNRLSDTGELELNVDSVLFSRIGKMEESMANFRENPMFGIGFQVMKSQFFIQNATLFSAPAEKGFLPSAVLEEGGVVGAFFFVVFIASLLLTFVVERNTPALVMFMTYMGSTMTEVTIFSPGGSGGFAWAMVAAAYVFGEMTWVKQQAPAGAARHAVLSAARPTIRGMAPHPVGLPYPG
ncbi:MAG: hypothetical protein ACKO9B_06265 [Planctomycetota bacterium]